MPAPGDPADECKAPGVAAGYVSAPPAAAPTYALDEERQTISGRLRLCAASRSRGVVRRRATGPGKHLELATPLRPEPEQRRSPTPDYPVRQTISGRLRLCAASRSRDVVRRRTTRSGSRSPAGYASAPRAGAET